MIILCFYFQAIARFRSAVVSRTVIWTVFRKIGVFCEIPRNVAIFSFICPFP